MYRNQSAAFLTMKEFLALVPLSEATVRRYMKKGLIPFEQPGGKRARVLFRADAMERCGVAKANPAEPQPEQATDPASPVVNPSTPTQTTKKASNKLRRGPVPKWLRGAQKAEKKED
jgi:hypothetical protein